MVFVSREVDILNVLDIAETKTIGTCFGLRFTSLLHALDLRGSEASAKQYIGDLATSPLSQLLSTESSLLYVAT